MIEVLVENADTRSTPLRVPIPTRIRTRIVSAPVDEAATVLVGATILFIML